MPSKTWKPSLVCVYKAAQGPKTCNKEVQAPLHLLENIRQDPTSQPKCPPPFAPTLSSFPGPAPASLQVQVQGRVSKIRAGLLTGWGLRHEWDSGSDPQRSTSGNSCIPSPAPNSQHQGCRTSSHFFEQDLMGPQHKTAQS
jgi:hypothetical protein